MVENENLSKIVAGCKKGDAESFSKLIDIYSSRCYGYFYRLTGRRDISDDLLSELFVKLVRKIRSFKGGGFTGWLFKVASNIFYDHLRDKLKQRKLLENYKAELETKTADETDSDSQSTDELQLNLARLDEDTRELIVLRFYSQLSFKELAKMRAEPIGTTLSKVHRGLKKLREMME